MQNYVNQKLKPKPKEKASTGGGFVAGTSPKPNDPSLKVATKRYENLIHNDELAEKTLQTVKDARNAVEKGGGDAGIVSFLGQFIPPLKSGHTATLENSAVQLFTHFKTIFPRMTNVDVGLIEDVLPAYGNSREANNAILDIFESGANFAREKKKVANRLWKEMNAGEFPPSEFESRLDEETGNMEEEALGAVRETATAIKDKVFERVPKGYTAMVDPEGKIKTVPNENVQKAMKKEWRLYGR